MGRINWVCASCAQHFTRRFTANRHNTNLHDGKGIIVRILDYIVGRINGQFLSQDPLAYRREKKNEKNLSDSNYSNYPESKVIADSTSEIISYDSRSLQPSKNNGPSNGYRSKNAYEKSCQHFRRRELYNGNSVEKAMAIRLTSGKSNPPLLYFPSPRSKPDDDDEEVSLDAFEQARATLSEIEELLTPHCPMEFVQNVIKQLIEICNSAGSYDILDEALENHKNLVNLVYLRRANKS